MSKVWVVTSKEFAPKKRAHSYLDFSIDKVITYRQFGRNEVCVQDPFNSIQIYSDDNPQTISLPLIYS